MDEPLSPDHVFDFPMNEPHPAYHFFLPAPLPEYAGNPNNNNGWLMADDYLDCQADVEGQMDAPMMDMEEDLAVLFGDDDFEDDASDGVVLSVPPPSIYEVEGPSTTVAEGPSFPQRVVHGSDAEIAAGVTIREIGPRVLAVEEQMQVMVSQMIQAVDRMEQFGVQVELGQHASTQRDETVTGLTQQVQALQADVQQRDTQI
ncbi:hypothetical protein Tco_0507644 [Tanacetum coccineum]